MIRRPSIKPPPPMSREIFSMGACVRVDPYTTSQGGIGFVTTVHTEERKVDIDYHENSIGIINSSPFIDEGRPHAQSFDLSGGGGVGGGTTRSGRRRRIEFGRGAIATSPTTTIRRRKKKKKMTEEYLRCNQLLQILSLLMSWLCRNPNMKQPACNQCLVHNTELVGVNHPGYEYFTGGIGDEFDQIWEADEEQRRQVAQFEAWYWELD